MIKILLECLKYKDYELVETELGHKIVIGDYEIHKTIDVIGRDVYYVLHAGVRTYLSPAWYWGHEAKLLRLVEKLI